MDSYTHERHEKFLRTRETVNTRETNSANDRHGLTLTKNMLENVAHPTISQAHVLDVNQARV